MSTVSHGSFNPAIGAMTAAERARGRYMRAPEHGGGTGDDDRGGGGGGTGLTLPDVVDSLDGLPERVRPLYVQKDDGKFHYDDVSSLRNALSNAKQERNSLRQKAGVASALEELGLSLDDVKELKKAKETAEEKRAREEGDWNSLKEQMETNHTNEKTKWTEREKKLLGTINRILVDDQARATLSDKDIDGSPTLLLPVIRDRVKVAETDDGFELQVLRSDGKSPMLNSENKPATLKDLFLELKGQDDFAGAFRGLNQNGGGTPANGKGGGAPGTKKRSEMTLVEKTAFVKEHGQDAYFKLPA